MTEQAEYQIHKADYVASEEELALYIFFQDHPECDSCFWVDPQGLPSEFCDNPEDCPYKKEEF